LESEDDRKLRLILSKAQQHQQQLREQLTVEGEFIHGLASHHKELGLYNSTESL